MYIGSVHIRESYNINFGMPNFLQKYYQGIQSSAVGHDTQSKYQWKVKCHKSVCVCVINDTDMSKFLTAFLSVCCWCGLW